MTNYQLSLIMLACISAITVAGVFAMTSLAGMFSLGQASYMCIGAYLTFCLAHYLKLPIILTAIVGIGICGLIALVIGLPTLKLRRDYFALMTVGFGQMVSSIIILLGDWTKASIGFSRIPKVENLVWLILGITAVIIFMVRNLKYSRFGRMCIALKTDEIAAKSFGIDVYKLKLKIYMVASMIAAVGGICYGFRNRVISPDAFGWSYSAEMQILLFFGGTNSLTGSVISAAALKVLPEFLKGIQLFGIDLQNFKTIIYCLLIIVILNFRTQGILGEMELSPKGLARKAKQLAKRAGGAKK